MNILQSSRKNIHVASAFRAVIFLVTGFHPDLQYRCELFFFLNVPLHLTGSDRSCPLQQNHYYSSRHIGLSCQYFQTQGQYQRKVLVTVLYHQPSSPYGYWDPWAFLASDSLVEVAYLCHWGFQAIILWVPGSVYFFAHVVYLSDYFLFN